MAGANRNAREDPIDAASCDFAGLPRGDFVGGVIEITETNGQSQALSRGIAGVRRLTARMAFRIDRKFSENVILSSHTR